MKDRIGRRQFRLVGIRSKGNFSEFVTIVPNISLEVMARSGEIESSSGREIAVFESRKSEDHLQGQFIAGLMVDNPIRHVPTGMIYMELVGDYASARGNIENLKNLHADLLKWAAGQGYQINRKEYIVEIYIPTDHHEDVEIYLPLLSSETQPNRTATSKPSHHFGEC